MSEAHAVCASERQLRYMTSLVHMAAAGAASAAGSKLHVTEVSIPAVSSCAGNEANVLSDLALHPCHHGYSHLAFDAAAAAAAAANLAAAHAGHLGCSAHMPAEGALAALPCIQL